MTSRDATPDARDAALASVLPVWPHEIADTSRAGRLALLARLRLALREERRRGRAGHWSYDLARHAALLAAYRAETRRLVADHPAEPPRNSRRVQLPPSARPAE
ncbi:MAG: hypothetical protein AB1749_07500 [Pseudomonadota bacterium]